MKPIRIALVVVVLAVVAVQGARAVLSRAASAAARRPSTLSLAPCTLSHPLIPDRITARCGTLVVPEDHAKPGGRTISLRVAVVEAEAGAKEPDPIFFLAGGPGQAATEVWPAVAPALARAARRRDVVLVDQRGTGSSARLDCDVERKAAQAAGADSFDEEVEQDDAAALARLTACGKRLAATHDLTRFRSEDFARDLDLVRAAVGAERIDLVGGSYGTRAALVYARLFPQRVRAMVLDGVAPLAMPVGALFERDAARALQVGFDRCRADAVCAKAHPDPAGALDRLLARLTAKAERVTLRDPVSGARKTVTVDADTVRGLVFLLAYTPETVALLPTLLDEAAAGDLAPLTALGVAGGRDLNGTISRPLMLAVLCAEDAPWFPAERPAPGPFGDTVRRSFEKACRVFPHGTVEPAFREPVRSDAPTLLLSGEADPVTPPSWAAVAAETLPRSRQLTLAGQGHGTLGRGCMPRVVADFLGGAGQAEPADPATLDAACLAHVRPQPFFLDLAGPPP